MLRKLIPLTVVALAATTMCATASAARPPLPPETPRIVPSACPGLAVAGCYDWLTNTIYSAGLNQYGLTHELGHAYDAQVLDDGERASFGQRIGRPHMPWESTYLPDGQSDVVGLEELFADAYASCRLGWMPRRHGRYAWTYTHAYNYEPHSNAQQRHTCAAISRWADVTPQG
jgi:hypothetical protein